MVQIVLILIGLIVCFLKSFIVSSKSEIRRPRTIIFGIIIIVSVALSYAISTMVKQGELLKNPGTTDFSLTWVLSYSLPLLIPFISAFFLKQRKEIAQENITTTPNAADKIASVITWIIILGIAGGIFYLVVK